CWGSPVTEYSLHDQTPPGYHSADYQILGWAGAIGQQHWTVCRHMSRGEAAQNRVAVGSHWCSAWALALTPASPTPARVTSLRGASAPAPRAPRGRRDC